MATRTLQPSEYEIQREVEALRDLRRRSTTPGALTIDPDLPNQSPPSSPTAHWSGKPPPSPSAASVFAHDSSSSDHNIPSNGGRAGTPDAPNNPSDDPLHLFWVPASLHPEIAPAEFRAFLKEHARSPVEAASPSSPSSLSPSGSLNRKKSMLSRQYRPKENDGAEEENIVPLKRNRSLLYPTNPGPQLTISDLQMLEELAEEASTSDDPSKLRSVLRRSLSLNLSPSAVDLMDEVPDMGDEADAPIIVPPPGQILRRAARTKIRKPGLPGDGGGHRFGASRRGTVPKTSPTAQQSEARTSSEFSSSDHGDVEASTPPFRRHTLSDESSTTTSRPDSYSEEASIFDAYARDDDDEAPYTPATITTSLSHEPIAIEEPPTQPEIASPQPQQFNEAPVLIHQPQPQRLLVPQPPPEQATPSRTPSPQQAPTPEPPLPVQQRPKPVHQQSSHQVPTTPSPPSSVRKEKPSKGLFKWGSDKGGKKGQKDKDRESRERAAEKEKESGFFGSLFGKKKQESEYQSSMTGHTSGREAAQALLGASKSYVPPTSPGMAPGLGGNPYARYPIHVERAIYRLSHIKLANPRRPLYEQVLISNLMFWYLGVINKAQNPSPPATTPAATPATGAGAAAPANGNHSAGGNGGTPEDEEREEREKAQREKEQREKEMREKAEKERVEKEQREREMMEQKRRESGKRGSLTKAPPGGQQGAGARRAEMPIKGPQYEMQHRVMEQEYGGYGNNGNGPPRSAGPQGAPPNMQMMNGGGPGGLPPQQAGGYAGHPQQQQRAPQPGPYRGPPPQQQQQQGYYQQPPENHRPGLPPGAMAPADQAGGWDGGRAGPQQSISPPPMQQQRRHPSPNAGQRRSNSPPMHGNNNQQYSQQFQHPQKQPGLHKLHTSQESLGHGAGPGSPQQGRSPSRSLSATAYSGNPSVNPALARKGNSAHAVTPYEKRPHTSDGMVNGHGEEEDVPLAVWQQQRRK